MVTSECSASEACVQDEYFEIKKKDRHWDRWLPEVEKRTVLRPTFVCARCTGRNWAAKPLDHQVSLSYLVTLFFLPSPRPFTVYSLLITVCTVRNVGPFEPLCASRCYSMCFSMSCSSRCISILQQILAPLRLAHLL